MRLVPIFALLCIQGTALSAQLIRIKLPPDTAKSADAAKRDVIPKGSFSVDTSGPAPRAQATASQRAQRAERETTAPASGWLTGQKAEDAKRRIDEERKRQRAQRAAEHQPYAPTPAMIDAAAKRRAAGLAPQADCNRAQSNIETIRDAQKNGARLYKLTLESGFKTVEKAEAEAILKESEKFVTERCGK